MEGPRVAMEQRGYKDGRWNARSVGKQEGKEGDRPRGEVGR